MTLYDLVVALFIALLVYRGFRAGLVASLLAWVAFGVGLLLAFRFDGVVAGWFAHNHTFAPTTWRVLAFVVILIVVEIAAGWLATRLSGILARHPDPGQPEPPGGSSRRRRCRPSSPCGW